MSARESRPNQAVEAAPEAFGGAEVQGSTGATEAFKGDLAIELLDGLGGHRRHIRIAHLVAARYLGRLIHVSGLGWLAWDGTRWDAEDGEKRATAAVMEAINSLWPLVGPSAPGAQKDKALEDDLLSASTAGGTRGVLHLTAALMGIAVSVSELDADPYVLNCANGTLDLRTGVLRDHDPVDYLTKVTRAAYNPDASFPLWEEFLERSLPDEEVRAYLQRFAGLSLIGKVLDHVFTIATGEGRNGKGVTYQTLCHTLGDYAGVADPALMEVVQANANAPSPAFFELRGRRLVVLSETDRKVRISAALLKRLTGGDPIKARALHRDPVEFLPAHSFLMVTNHLPELPSEASDPAVWARVRVVPFDVEIPKAERDLTLDEKLKAGADAVLAWMVEGLRQYWEMGLAEPEAVERRTRDYADDQDLIRKFIEDECEVDDLPDNAGATTTTLHEAYKAWCASEGVYKRDQLGRQKFAHALAQMGYPSSKTRRGMVHDGIELRVVVEADSEANSEAMPLPRELAHAQAIEAAAAPTAPAAGPASARATFGSLATPNDTERNPS